MDGTGAELPAPARGDGRFRTPQRLAGVILGEDNAVPLLPDPRPTANRAPSQELWVVQLFHAGVEIVAVTMQNGSWDHPIRFLS